MSTSIFGRSKKKKGTQPVDSVWSNNLEASFWPQKGWRKRGYSFTLKRLEEGRFGKLWFRSSFEPANFIDMLDLLRRVALWYLDAEELPKNVRNEMQVMSDLLGEFITSITKLRVRNTSNGAARQ